MTTYTTLISAPELRALAASGAPLMVFDCSFDLAQPGAGAQHYLQAHIPGAVHADLDRTLSALHGAPGHDVKLLRVALEAVKPAGFIKLKLLAKFGAPLRMGKVARAQDVYALAARPCGQMAGVEGLAGGAGKTGMDMQVGYEVHTRLFVMVR